MQGEYDSNNIVEVVSTSSNFNFNFNFQLSNYKYGKYGHPAREFKNGSCGAETPGARDLILLCAR
ncbi:MAG: hypothetical protein JWO20_514 [Candidatus Angelobacter sp.]|nr:hypothetical protein [Candidatus Angelobacter sp.]